MIRFLSWLVAISPKCKRSLWKAWYDLLSVHYPRRDWTFMNYGYVDLCPEGKPVRLQEGDEPDRYFIQLYHHVASVLDLRRAAVLELGSGRGGGSSYIARYLQPASVCGVDYSKSAVAFCRKVHQGVPNLTFQQGDAEAIPLNDAAFDVVVNVESSHCYASMERFLNEVFRVLKPGGHFLWADMCSHDKIEVMRQDFCRAGFVLLSERRITPNVLQAMRLFHDSKKALIRSHVPWYLTRAFGSFAGLEGSPIYEQLRVGSTEYLSCVLRKPDA